MRSVLFILSVAAVAAIATGAPAEPSAERGARVFAAAGCAGCHTRPEGPALAGGRAIETPFGTFYAPNITPDPDHGIGGWEPEDLIRALRAGIAPDGAHYFPSFPYSAYTGMAEHDMRDLYAYLRTVEPVAEPNRPHELTFPFSWRFAVTGWKWLNFEPGPFEPDPGRSDRWNRGAYLVEALGHCGECHTPRGPLGGLDRSMHLAGSATGAEGEPAPNITPAAETGLGGWTKDDMIWLLQVGLLPDGDVVGGPMGEVVEHSTSKLPAEDREAMAAYLLSLPPVEHRVGGGRKEDGAE